MQQESEYARTTSVSLPMSSATPLAYVMVDRLARKHDIRALAIKGPVLAELGLRPRKVSSDADILVEPGRIAELCAVLEAKGWKDREVRFSPSILDPHSRTLIHPEWPCDIDVHSYFPGFFGSPEDVFESLWAGRTRVRMANMDVQTPSRVANGVVALLHLKRNSPDSNDNSYHRALMEALVESDGPGQRAELEYLARAGRFRRILEPELRSLGLEGSFDDVSDRDMARWEINRTTHAEATTGSWLYAIRTASGWSKMTVFVKAVYPSSAELRKDPGMEESGVLRLMGVRTKRLVHGVRTLPSAVVSLFRNWRQ
ncbi:nucleotidyltransferase family protein [Arthrobacter sp. RAF14]|uniref:nucleotidyltransferase family protein n=1 Tax=Arthrobacter sp. RAF14 TaxID=3233051 RepID=UPI003F91A24E